MSNFTNHQNLLIDAIITVGAENTNAITCSIQLVDRYDRNELACRAAIWWYLAADANGDTKATAPNGGTAAGTDGVLWEWTAELAGMAISESDGDIDIVITDSGTPTVYLILVMPDGKLIPSGAITFA